MVVESYIYENKSQCEPDGLKSKEGAGDRERRTAATQLGHWVRHVVATVETVVIELQIMLDRDYGCVDATECKRARWLGSERVKHLDAFGSLAVIIDTKAPASYDL